jgi:hypothetical protein
VLCSRDDHHVDIRGAGRSPRLDARLDRRPRVLGAVEDQRRHPHRRERRARVEVHLLDPQAHALLVEQPRRQPQLSNPRLVEGGEQVGRELLVGLGRDRVHPVLEPSPQLERAFYRLVPVAGQAQLALDRVHHLLGRRHPGGGDEDEERDLVRGCGGERPDPAALADPPEADPFCVDGPQHGQRVVDLELEPAARRVAGRLAFAAAVEGHDADPVRRQKLVQVLQRRRLARPLAGPVKRDESRRAGARVAGGQREAVALDPQLVQPSSCGSGLACTTTSVVVGRVSAT